MATLSVDTRPTLTQQGIALYQVTMPLLAGVTMLAASQLPWLIDPLGKTFSAWQLPVDIGWQLRTDIFSYGLLCLCCAFYALYIAYLTWKASRRDRTFPRSHVPTAHNPRRDWAGPCPPVSLSCTHEQRPAQSLRRLRTLAGLLCLMPIGLFFTQYLFIDMGSIALLTQHEFQALFIHNHFGYHVAAQFIPIRLDTFDPSTLNGRFTLLLDQIQPGLYLPLLASFCLLSRQGGRRQATPVEAGMWQQLGQQKHLRIVTIIASFVLLLIVLGRGPVALACRFQAEHLLTTGDYADALVWLDRAARFNPSLEQLPAYHIERGQAWYYLHPTQPSIESQIYLAAFYLTQDDYLSAYQKLMAARQQNVGTLVPSWLIDELSMTLTRLAEMSHPLSGSPVPRANKDRPSIIWLNMLIHIDPSNVYAHYTLGRIEYDLHDFTTCERQMLSVTDLSSDPDILSSVYTYLSLSSESEGNYVQARDYLFEAQALDPSYRNNTAREEMSGLH